MTSGNGGKSDGGNGLARAGGRTVLGPGLAFPILALAGLLALSGNARAGGTGQDFRFPVVLCDFQYSLVDEQDGYLQLVHRHSGEQIFRVRNTSAARGEIKGEYPIEGTPYRFTFTGRIEQGSATQPHRMLLRSRLERLDPASGEYVFAGQRTSAASQPDGPDGTLLRKVAARSLNFGLDSYKGADGRFDLAKIERGIQWRKLAKGTVFRAGPVCLLADVETVRQVTSRPAELADVFRRYDEEHRALMPPAGGQLASARQGQADPAPSSASVASLAEAARVAAASSQSVVSAQPVISAQPVASAQPVVSTQPVASASDIPGVRGVDAPPPVQPPTPGQDPQSQDLQSQDPRSQDSQSQDPQSQDSQSQDSQSQDSQSQDPQVADSESQNAQLPSAGQPVAGQDPEQRSRQELEARAETQAPGQAIMPSPAASGPVPHSF